LTSPPVSPDARPGRFPFRTPATLTLLLLTVGAFVGQVLAGGDAGERAFGLIPARVSAPSSLPNAAGGQPIPAWLTLLTYLFLHGGWWHVAINMAGLAWLGWYAEPALGTRRFVLAYLSFGVVTGLAIVLLGPHWTRSFVGASGVINGVLGGFLALHLSGRLLRGRSNLVALAVESAFVLAVAGWLLGRTPPAEADRPSAVLFHLIPFLAGWLAVRMWGQGMKLGRG
jgi:membrane associated rhomboid family serine protease